MKLIVLHGNDVEKSAQRLATFTKSATKRGFNVVRATWEELLFDLRSQNLFEVPKLLIIDEVTGVTSEFFTALEKDTSAKTVVIFAKKELSITFLKKLPKGAVIEKYDLPKTLFQFLESVYPNNGQRALKLLYDTQKTTSLELIFFMLARHLKDLYWVRKAPSSIPYPSWRVQKLESQSNKYNEVKLKDALSQLLSIDYLAKTSDNPLSSLLDDFLLINLK